MLDKIDLIPHEKLAVAFGYYVVNVVDREVYQLYSNPEGDYLILFLDRTGEMCFVEMNSFRKMNRRELFIFLSDDMREANVRETIIRANAIESYTEASFSKRTTMDQMVAGFLNLRKGRVFDDENPLSRICYDKDGFHVSLLYSDGEPKGFPIEMINFDSDLEEVRSYMGNDGLFISILPEGPVHLTYHPFFLKNVDIENESFIICKYNPDVFTIMKILETTSGRKLSIASQGRASLLFKLRFLLKTLEIRKEGINMDIEVSENKKQFNIHWKIDKGSSSKLHLFNLLNKAKKKITALYADYGSDIRDGIKDMYGLEIESLKLEGSTYGRMVAKYNTDVIDIFVGVFEKESQDPGQ